MEKRRGVCAHVISSLLTVLSWSSLISPPLLGMDHVITIQFRHVESVALIRFWNYNKSRTYSFRGARDVDISLDGIFIFKGEISKAQGDVSGERDFVRF